MCLFDVDLEMSKKFTGNQKMQIFQNKVSSSEKKYNRVGLFESQWTLTQD